MTDYEENEKGLWCDFCGKRHAGRCEKPMTEYSKGYEEGNKTMLSQPSSYPTTSDISQFMQSIGYKWSNQAQVYFHDLPCRCLPLHKTPQTIDRATAECMYKTLFGNVAYPTSNKTETLTALLTKVRGMKADDMAEVICPVCGMYCNGKGGVGCIFKNDMFWKEAGFNVALSEVEKVIEEMMK